MTENRTCLECPSMVGIDAMGRGHRADAFLARKLPFLSRARIRRNIQTGKWLLNGGRFASSARLRDGDVIAVYGRVDGDHRSAPSLAILYEDEFLVAVDKPAGMAVHPTGRIRSGTAIQFIIERLAGSRSANPACSDAVECPGLVGRLDMLTSGVVLAAKSRDALVMMQRQVERRGVKKRYLALVEGTVEAGEGRIELPIGRDERSAVRIKMTVRQDGFRAVTDFRVLRRLSGLTLLEAYPITGRQHQIRTHLAAIGHPVLGDLLYKDERLFLRYWDNGCVMDESLPSRHFLHAEAMGFVHPITGLKVAIHSPVPQGFESGSCA